MTKETLLNGVSTSVTILKQYLPFLAVVLLYKTKSFLHTYFFIFLINTHTLEMLITRVANFDVFKSVMYSTDYSILYFIESQFIYFFDAFMARE